MHPFVLNNNSKATVFHLREIYPRFSLPLFLPQSRGLPSVSPHHYVIAPDSKSSERVLFTHVVFTPCKHCPKQFQRDSILERSNMQRIMVARVRNICSMRHRIHPERGADAALGRRLLGNLLRPSKRLAIFPRMRRRLGTFIHLADAFIQSGLQLMNTTSYSTRDDNKHE